MLAAFASAGCAAPADQAGQQDPDTQHASESFHQRRRRVHDPGAPSGAAGVEAGGEAGGEAAEGPEEAGLEEEGLEEEGLEEEVLEAGDCMGSFRKAFRLPQKA